MTHKIACSAKRGFWWSRIGLNLRSNLTIECYLLYKHLFASFLKEKAIANATIVADVGSTYEKWCDL
jgi:hypothetical protein